jgi:hypothetical protein
MTHMANPEADCCLYHAIINALDRYTEAHSSPQNIDDAIDALITVTAELMAMYHDAKDREHVSRPQLFRGGRMTLLTPLNGQCAVGGLRDAGPVRKFVVKREADKLVARAREFHAIGRYPGVRVRGPVPGSCPNVRARRRPSQSPLPGPAQKKPQPSSDHRRRANPTRRQLRHLIRWLPIANQTKLVPRAAKVHSTVLVFAGAVADECPFAPDPSDTHLRAQTNAVGRGYGGNCS